MADEGSQPGPTGSSRLCLMRYGGRLRQIDLIERAKELGLLAANESPLAGW
jgi:hypothetical protein